MSFWTLLLIFHLLVTTYSFFLVWKEDRIYQGDFIDQLVNDQAGRVTHHQISSLTVFFCLCPLVNLITLWLWVWCDLVDVFRIFLLGLMRLLLVINPSLKS